MNVRWVNHENGLWAQPPKGGRLKLGSGAHRTHDEAVAAQQARCRMIASNGYIRHHHWAQANRALYWLQQRGLAA